MLNNHIWKGPQGIPKGKGKVRELKELDKLVVGPSLISEIRKKDLKNFYVTMSFSTLDCGVQCITKYIETMHNIIYGDMVINNSKR